MHEFTISVIRHSSHAVPMKPLSDCLLYAFVDSEYLRGRNPVDVAKQLCDGEADLIQLRAKRSSRDQIRQLAEAIALITRPEGVNLVINDHPQIAREIGAQFCHLGQEDFFGAGCRHVSGVVSPDESPKMGLSSHAPDQAERAIRAGAAYIAVGPVYATGTKPNAVPVARDY